MPSQVYQIGDFNIGNSWVVNADGTQKTKPSVVQETKTIEIVLPYGSTVTDALLRVTCGSPRTWTRVLSVCDHALSVNQENLVDLTSEVSNRENDTVSLVFKYQDNGGSSSSGSERTVYWTMHYTDIELEVRWIERGGDEPEDQEYTDRPLRTEVPDGAIALCDGQTRGVIALLHPLECTISEEAGGEYELALTYPMDNDVWSAIKTDRIINAPVPKMHLEGIRVENPTFWQTTADTTLWKKLPSSYSKKTKQVVQAFSYLDRYEYGNLVSHNGRVYRFAESSGYAEAPPAYPWVLTNLPAETESSETVQVPGVKEADLESGTRLIKLADHNATYMRVQAASGKIGYVKIADCETVTPTSQEEEGTYYTIQPRTITRQYFRIYRTEISSYDRTVKVSAKHISYDLDSMLLGQCSLVKASPQVALSFMQQCFIENDLDDTYTKDERTIATDITEGEITQDWSYASPVSALLDPETGVVDILKARLYRDNDDFILIKNGTTNPNYIIRYGTNLIGVTISTDSSELVTRIIPVAKDAQGDPYHLPEQYVDSDLISRYSVIRYEIIEVDAQIGKQYTPSGESEPVTYTEAMVKTIMRNKAAKRFTDDWCDQPKLELAVEFLMLGDTEEYRQYRGLQSLNLYDIVRVVHPEIGIDVNIQVRGYDWDAVHRRYLSITLGNPFDYGKGSVAGYQIGTRAITERALSPELKAKIGG